MAHRLDLALDATVAETAGDENAVDVAERRAGAVFLDLLGVDPIHVDARIVGDAAVGQRFRQALVRVLHLDVLADHGDAGGVLRRLHASDDVLPAREVRGVWLEDRKSTRLNYSHRT